MRRAVGAGVGTMNKLKTFAGKLGPRHMRQVLGQVKPRFRRMSGPAPYHAFSDYDDYWNQRKKLGGVMRRWELAADAIRGPASVLDVGCGSGEFLAYLRERHPDVALKGTDLSAVAVENTKAQGLDALVFDVVTEELKEEYDYITCFEVLEHLAEAETALRHIKNAFRRKLIVSIPNVGYIGCRLRLALFGRFPVTMCVYHIKEHLRHWTPKDFAEFMRREGLRIESFEGQYGPPWLPWRRMPGLFASGLVYVIVRGDAEERIEGDTHRSNG